MGLVTGLLTLPLAPVRAVVWLGEAVRDQVDAQTRDPAAMRRQVEEIEEREQAGELSPDEAREAQQAVLDRAVGTDGED
ncbi:MAG TPA: gas vesicle protein GvpG [Actinocatenispora sp.]